MQRLTVEKIQAACKAGTVRQILEVSDTFGDGQYTYTVIGIDQDIPCDADGNPVPTSQYRNVLTVMCLGAPVGKGGSLPVAMDESKTPIGTVPQQMNSSGTNSGSWEASAMRTTTMASYLAKLPADTQNAIGYVQKITGQYNNSTNIATGDKCFLLSGKEIFGGTGSGKGSNCTTAEADATFQYQYFANIATTRANRIITDSYNARWWLRSPCCDNSVAFCNVSVGNSGNNVAYEELGVFPAFCIY